MKKLEKRAIVDALVVSVLMRKIDEPKRMAYVIPAVVKAKDNTKLHYANWVEPQIEQYFSASKEDL